MVVPVDGREKGSFNSSQLSSQKLQYIKKKPGWLQAFQAFE
jgi:hypothetical protein